MGKGLPYSMRRGSAQTGPAMKKLRIALDALPITVTNGAPGFGTVVVGDFPEGNVVYFGAVANMQFTKTDADIIATFEGDAALGTAATADGSLAAGEVDLIASASMGIAAVSSVSPMTRYASAAALAGTIFDNTDGSLEINLNVLIDDGSISADGSLTVSGWVEILYATLGDD
jgi:hypothetical protein